MAPPADQSNDQVDYRAPPSTIGYGIDSKTTLPPLGSTMKQEQSESYPQTQPQQQQQAYDYSAQPSIYSAYQQSNYDPYQRQNILQPQNTFTGMTQYTQPTYTTANTSTGIRYSYPNSVSGVAVPTTKSDTQPPIPQEKKSRRFRRRYNQIVRKYPCSYPGCSKSYGSLNHLNTHIVTKKHGPRKSKLDFQNGSQSKEDKQEANYTQPEHLQPQSSSQVSQPSQYQLPQQSQIPVPPQQYVTQPNDYSGYYYGYTAPPNLRPSVSTDSTQIPAPNAGLYYSGFQGATPLTTQQAQQAQQASQVQPQRSGGGSTSTSQYYQTVPQQNLYQSQFQQQQTLGAALRKDLSGQVATGRMTDTNVSAANLNQDEPTMEKGDNSNLGTENESVEEGTTDSSHNNESTQSKEPTTKPPKKRLTLQERLAQAAKGKKKSGTKSLANGEQNQAQGETPSPQISPQVTGNHETHGNEMNYKAEIEKLKLENASLKSKKPDSFEKERNELLDKLKTKDETIVQLLKEGEALSHKELKLNDSIKKLKLANQTLEEDMAEYAKKHDTALVSSQELQEFLKSNKLKTVDQLLAKFVTINQDLNTSRSEVDKLRQSEIKYHELSKQHEEVTATRKELTKEVNALKVEHDMAMKQYGLDLESKQETINSQKEELSKARQSYSEEITRLEEKIESLRFDHEVPTVPHSDDKIDFDDFKKLSDSHHVLQKQYLSSQENWKLIESNLSLKVDTLTSALDAAKRAKTKLSNDLIKANGALQSQSNEIRSLQDEKEELQEQINKLQLSIKLKDDDIKVVNEKLERLQAVFTQERSNLNIKITSLNETIESLKEEQRQQGYQQPKLTRDSSLSSDLSWNEIRLGESSNTPALNKEFGMFSNRSSASFTEIGEGESLERESYLTPGFGVSISGLNGSTGGLGVPSTITNGNNLQLIHKMSSNIRRLEIELNTLKDEYEKLLDVKESREQELLESIKVNEQVQELKTKIEDLQSAIEEKDVKEQTMLELIGEKSEQVEELKADVSDLKDLCRNQVQQMVEMQGFIYNNLIAKLIPRSGKDEFQFYMVDVSGKLSPSGSVFLDESVIDFTLGKTSSSAKKRELNGSAKSLKNIDDSVIAVLSSGDIVTISVHSRTVMKHDVKMKLTQIIALEDNTIWGLSKGNLYKVALDGKYNKVKVPDFKTVVVKNGVVYIGTSVGLLVGKISKNAFVKEKEIETDFEVVSIEVSGSTIVASSSSRAVLIDSNLDKKELAVGHDLKVQVAEEIYIISGDSLKIFTSTGNYIKSIETPHPVDYVFTIEGTSNVSWHNGTDIHVQNFSHETNTISFQNGISANPKSSTLIDIGYPVDELDVKTVETQLHENLSQSKTDKEEVTGICSSLHNDQDVKQIVTNLPHEYVERLFQVIDTNNPIWLKWILLIHGNSIANSSISVKGLQQSLRSNVETMPHFRR
ncbi:hypothetical protein CANMA_003836 [Candida margitis]|uniref:uncharacterized protein n=1 Tax=Candida margitis TaxID=1775924 RepID=UPI002227C5B3|nr:uncharacterized protein CANMA_003836 [Candida margitis]KAI5961316.1 hypothetical protein CANMA_003836 [Candida margitis]